MEKRVFLLLLDSLGIGALDDASKFDDVGSNTLRNIIEYCAIGKADKNGVRCGPLQINNLIRLGLLAAEENDSNFRAAGKYGSSCEISFGKDTSSGHWEMMGVPVLFNWGYFPSSYPSFPEELTNSLIREVAIPGILGNCAASGTAIINRLGDEHIRTSMPICYTSADSVFQVAAHEESFGLESLYEFCKVAFDLVKPYNICRVIARPFVGSTGNYRRTKNRRDFSHPPHELTLLDKMLAAHKQVVAIGKIADIFANQGISKRLNVYGNEKIFDAVLSSVQKAEANSLVFANFVDFDTEYGHRRDVAGYAKALEDFDLMIPKLEEILKPGDIAIITADHGCDPTFKGTDHTRERVPILVFGPGINSEYLGVRRTFADIGQSIASYLSLDPLVYGEGFSFI